jgi:hypothetical protein
MEIFALRWMLTIPPCPPNPDTHLHACPSAYLPSPSSLLTSPSNHSFPESNHRINPNAFPSTLALLGPLPGPGAFFFFPPTPFPSSPAAIPANLSLSNSISSPRTDADPARPAAAFPFPFAEEVEGSEDVCATGESGSGAE